MGTNPNPQQKDCKKCTWYILSPPLGHIQLQPPADHMLTPSLSPVCEVAKE